jgi:hypothetical protein
MGKLEIKHLAPYLPYGLKSIYNGRIVEIEAVGNEYILTDESFQENIKFEHIKPILYPLSYIKNFEDIMDEFSEYSWEVFENHFFVLGRTLNCFDSITYTIAELCFKHNLDLFGLIEKGLAIDINSIKKDKHE